MALPAANSNLFARASLFLVGLAWTLPFLQPYHHLPLSAFYSEWLAFTLGLAAATLLIKKGHSISLPVPLVSMAPLGLIVLFTIQVALERVPYPEQAITATLYLLWALILLVLGAVLRREFELRDVAVVLSWALVIGGIFNAVIGVLQHYSVRTPLEHLIAPKVYGLVYGNIAQHNSFANYITLALTGLAYLVARERVSIFFAIGAAIISLVVLPLSGSRASWLYFVLIVALSLALHLRERSVISKRLLIFSGCLVAGLVAAHLIVTVPEVRPTSTPTITSGQRLLDSASWIVEHGKLESAPGVADRLQELRYAWWMFLESPFLGAGLGQFAWHHFEYMARTGNFDTPRLVNHAHNIVFHFLAETGIVGVLFVLGPVFVWLAGLRRLKFDLECWWLLTLLGVLGIHSMLEYPLWYSFFLGIAALLLGLGATHLTTLRLAMSGPLVVSLVLAFGWLHAITVLQSYRDFERIAFSTTKSNAMPEGRTLTEALIPLHREPVLTPYVEIVMSFWMTISEENLREKLELNTRAMRFAPMGYMVYRQAVLLAMNGQHDLALRLFGSAALVFPEGLPEIIAVLEQLNRAHPERFARLLQAAVSRNTYP